MIEYHRSYRKIGKSYKDLIIEFILLTSPFLTIILLFLEKIIDFISDFSLYHLSSYFYVSTTQINFLFWRLKLIEFSAPYPTNSLCLFAIVVSILFIILLRKVNIPILFYLFISYNFIILLISALYFLFFKERFPYDIKTFSELYIKMQIGIILFSIISLGIGLSVLPSPIFLDFIVALGIFTYSIVFSAVRYTLFLFLLKKLSYLVMPLFFFNFGPLLDFVYVIGIYSFYVSILANRYKNKLEVWKWLY